MAAKKGTEKALAPAPEQKPPTSLYALTDEALRLDQEIAVIGGDVSEGTAGADLAEKLAWVREMIVRKVDNVVRYVRSLKAHRDGIAAEIEWLKALQGYDDNKMERLKGLCMDVMKLQGPDVLELKGDIFKIARQKNGGATPIKLLEEDVTKWPERFTKWLPSIDQEAVRKALQAEREAIEAAVAAGTPPPARDPELAKFAEFGEVGQHIRFK